MAAALLSSGRHLLIRSFPKPNNLLIRMSPFSLSRNPSRLISCSASDPQLSSPRNLGSTQRFGSRSPFLLLADRKMKTLINTPALVTAAITLKGWDTGSILHFSMYDSDLKLLKQFSKAVIHYKPFVMSACRHLVLFRDRYAFLCDIDTQALINLPGSDDDEPACVTGFGYVPSTKKFKLLSGSESVFRILTLGNKRWRDVEDPPFEVMDSIGRYAVANGAIHFESGTGDRIATFNLEREEWGSIAAPPCVYRIDSYILQEISGYLCATEQCYKYLIIWLFKYSDNMWIKLCTIDKFIWNAQLFPDALRPLAIGNDGRILILIKTNKTASLLFYDPKTESSQEIHSFGTQYFYMGFYAQVLSSLGHL